MTASRQRFAGRFIAASFLDVDSNRERIASRNTACAEELIQRIDLDLVVFSDPILAWIA